MMRYEVIKFLVLFTVCLTWSCVLAEGGRLSDLVARFKSAEVTTKKPTGLDTLLENFEKDRESTHRKSWGKLDGHRHKTLSSLLDEYYPEDSPKRHSAEDKNKSKPLSFFDGLHSVSTESPFNSGHRSHSHQHSRDGKKGRHSLSSLLDGSEHGRTTPGPLFESEPGSSSEERKYFLDPTVPTRHHHRYHRGDGLSPHQLQADSTFSQPSVSGYYDYSASGGSPSVKSTRLNSLDWKKTARKIDRNRWTSTSKNSGAGGTVIATLSRGDADNQASAYRLASLHVKAAKELACKLPQPKIIRISDHYPSADKLYFPSCTRLHQCAQDTGCCIPSKKCGPKSTQRVELYFYSTSMKAGSGDTSPIQIEKLPFYNHTECECQDRNDEMPRDKEQLSSNSISSQYNLDTSNRNVCLCPLEFTLKFLPNGSCACDCFDKQKECTKYKRGKEFFNNKDKMCIALNKCVIPMCDYGTYNRRYGRCPRKHERHKSSWSKYN